MPAYAVLLLAIRCLCRPSIYKPCLDIYGRTKVNCQDAKLGVKTSLSLLQSIRWLQSILTKTSLWCRYLVEWRRKSRPHLLAIFWTLKFTRKRIPMKLIAKPFKRYQLSFDYLVKMTRAMLALLYDAGRTAVYDSWLSVANRTGIGSCKEATTCKHRRQQDVTPLMVLT